MNIALAGVDPNAASHKVASSLASTRGQGMQTSATAIRPKATNGVMASAAASATGNTASTASTASTAGDITSNDFLTLLVTEMQNQDPTQPTDPNAYIQQLVGVNSLQQLISINGELGGTSSSSGSAGNNVAPVSSVSPFSPAAATPTSSLFGS